MSKGVPLARGEAVARAAAATLMRPARGVAMGAPRVPGPKRGHPSFRPIQSCVLGPLAILFTKYLILN